MENTVLFNAHHPIPTAPIICYEYIFLLCGQSPTSHHKCLMIQAIKASLALIHILSMKNSKSNSSIIRQTGFLPIP